MKNLEFCVDYDEGADVLYISIGKPRPGYGDMIDDVVVIRRDFNTHEVIGLTIVGAKKGLAKGIVQRDFESPEFPFDKDEMLKLINRTLKRFSRS